MPEEKFVVLSIDDASSKDVAKVLSNDTSRKILEKLASRLHSPTELSNSLKIPLSTVEYNLDLLKKAGMIKLKGFKYSKKGKNIKYYEPAKKIIIIAPEKQSKENIFNILKDKLLVPLIVASSICTGYFVNTLFTRETYASRGDMAIAKSIDVSEWGAIYTPTMAMRDAIHINLPLILFIIMLVSLIIFLIIMFYKRKTSK